MAFYTIQESWNGYEIFFEDGVFDESGAKEALGALCDDCVKKIQNKMLSRSKDLSVYKEEETVLNAVMEFYESKKTSPDTKRCIKNRIEALNTKIKTATEEIENMKSLLSGTSVNDVISFCGYKIVEVPIFSQCDDKLLKEFV